MSTVVLLGRDDIGYVAESDGFRYYLTDCCGASGKGLMDDESGEGYVGCRHCYTEVDPEIGGVPPTPGKCSCMTLGGVTYGAGSCPVHGTVPASRTLRPAEAPAHWPAH